MDAAALLTELDPVAGRLFERHLATTREWYPHEHVPYGRARDFAAGTRWCAGDADCGGATVSDAVRSALFVNVLTEDNLPYYFRDVERLFGSKGALGQWARWWTAEEGRHSIVLRDYLTVTRAVDPWELERARMAQVSRGEVPDPGGPEHGLVYLTLQELATRISHRNTGKLVGDSAAYEVMARVSFDENLHHLFYRDLATAALELDPSEMVIAIDDVVRTFEMPGTGIPGFTAHAKAIARAGVYDLASHHSQILVPVVLRHWRIESLAGLTDEAQLARDRVLDYIERMGRVAERLLSRRSEQESTATR